LAPARLGMAGVQRESRRLMQSRASPSPPRLLDIERTSETCNGWNRSLLLLHGVFGPAGSEQWQGLHKQITLSAVTGHATIFHYGLLMHDISGLT
jgi:hypothetical protein